MSDPRVCHHGGLRRQCEACDLAERLATAVQLLRSWTEDGTPWDEYSDCSFCGERWRNPRVHGKDCAWVAALAFVESEPEGRG